MLIEPTTLLVLIHPLLALTRLAALAEARLLLEWPRLTLFQLVVAIPQTLNHRWGELSELVFQVETSLQAIEFQAAACLWFLGLALVRFVHLERANFLLAAMELFLAAVKVKYLVLKRDLCFHLAVGVLEFLVKAAVVSVLLELVVALVLGRACLVVRNLVVVAHTHYYRRILRHLRCCYPTLLALHNHFELIVSLLLVSRC